MMNIAMDSTKTQYAQVPRMSFAVEVIPDSPSSYIIASVLNMNRKIPLTSRIEDIGILFLWRNAVIFITSNLIVNHLKSFSGKFRQYILFRLDIQSD